MMGRLEQPQCLGQIRGWLCFAFVLCTNTLRETRESLMSQMNAHVLNPELHLKKGHPTPYRETEKPCTAAEAATSPRPHCLEPQNVAGGSTGGRGCGSGIRGRTGRGSLGKLRRMLKLCMRTPNSPSFRRRQRKHNPAEHRGPAPIEPRTSRIRSLHLRQKRWWLQRQRLLRPRPFQDGMARWVPLVVGFELLLLL